MKKSLVTYIVIVIIFAVTTIGVLLWRSNTTGYQIADFNAPTMKKINLNTASAQQLQMIPRIGPSLSERIIAYREENGPFKKVDDILNVKGIGMQMLSDFYKYTTTGE